MKKYKAEVIETIRNNGKVEFTVRIKERWSFLCFSWYSYLTSSYIAEGEDYDLVSYYYEAKKFPTFGEAKVEALKKLEALREHEEIVKSKEVKSTRKIEI